MRKDKSLSESTIVVLPKAAPPWQLLCILLMGILAAAAFAEPLAHFLLHR